MFSGQAEKYLKVRRSRKFAERNYNKLAKFSLKLISQGIWHNFSSADPSKSIPQLIMSIFTFSQDYFQ